MCIEMKLRHQSPMRSIFSTFQNLLAAFVLAFFTPGYAEVVSAQAVPDDDAPQAVAAAMPPGIRTVFLILFENKDWTDILGSPSAPYINSILPMASYCEQYYNPPDLHP